MFNLFKKRKKEEPNEIIKEMMKNDDNYMSPAMYNIARELKDNDGIITLNNDLQMRYNKYTNDILFKITSGSKSGQSYCIQLSIPIEKALLQIVAIREHIYTNSIIGCKKGYRIKLWSNLYNQYGISLLRDKTIIFSTSYPNTLLYRMMIYGIIYWIKEE